MTLHRLLLHSASQTPDQTALRVDDATLTWREYERASRRLATTLIRAGVRRGDRIAISRMKSVESYIAVHGALRAGAVWVPIDPLAPAATARSVLAEADVVGAILDDQSTRALDPATNLVGARIVIGPGFVEWDDAVADDATDATDLPDLGDDDGAYIIFTSGSTGRPKGIVHTHRSARAYADAAVAGHRMTDADVVSGMCPFHFDMSTLELYAAPLAGAPVVAMTEGVMRFPASVADRIVEHGLTLIYTVPFFLRSLTERGDLESRDLSALRQIVYCGEPYAPNAVAELIALVPEHVVVTNAYGPAETNVCNINDIDELDPDGGEVPIGPAWPAARARVVDEAGVDTAADEPGELLIAGETLMVGYWRRDDLTAAAIVVDDDGTRWYRTGDLVTMDADGVCVFLGRVDNQVKVRGVRLELEAIESVLTDAPGIAHAVVGPVGRPGMIDHLGAVVVEREGQPLDAKGVRRWCAARLNPAGVPQWFETLDALPETASGKIDRKVIREGIARRTEEQSVADHLQGENRAR